ncbi:hypothetical protein HXX76_008877 [Chlamydomonas incerta]|uniref:Uncharacterized protein n=1 Tax=Chlamydomonas incerta TaxID=51695 RepID=A0A835SSH7_CHLIN|nr:hypothetical protein HXX76_008877 [Chlamydomonas incerta]|eukprot:KAG2432532.1 hypothetical protein HXX76_008877 [Chlamydomonas incerta]
MAAAVAMTVLLMASTAFARKATFAVARRHLLAAASVDDSACPATEPSSFCDNFFSSCASFSCTGGVVTIDLTGSACKQDGTFSWGACLKSDGSQCGTMTSCDGTSTSSQKGTYCKEYHVMSFAIAEGTTSVGIQVHDGTFSGNGVNLCTLTNPAGNGCFSGNSDGCKVCVPATCPIANMAAAGIPELGCSTCSPAEVCFKETKDSKFDNPLTTNSLLTVTSCLAKPAGSFAYSPAPGVNLQVNYYPPLLTSTYKYFTAASTTVGTGKAITCYTDTTYAVVDKYVYIERMTTAADNYDCLDCLWFKVYTVKKPSTCRCSTDTAWAFPVKSTLQNGLTAAQLSATTEVQLPSPDYPGNVYWAAKQEDNSQAWGGYFHITPPLGTTTYTFDMCAGCAKNSLGTKGFIMGKLSVVFTNNLDGQTSSYSFFEPTAGAYSTSSVLQVYQSFTAPPSLTPGQFQKFTVLGNFPGLPFGYNTQWQVTKVNTGPIKSGQTTLATVPTSMGTVGVYIAVHMTVGGSYCDAPVAP